MARPLCSAVAVGYLGLLRFARIFNIYADYTPGNRPLSRPAALLALPFPVRGRDVFAGQPPLPVAGPGFRRGGILHFGLRAGTELFLRRLLAAQPAANHLAQQRI